MKPAPSLASADDSEVSDPELLRAAIDDLTPLELVIGNQGTLEKVHVRQVVNSQQMLVEYADEIFAITDHPTEGLADGNWYYFDGGFYVVGTITYDTADGARTVYEVRPMTGDQKEALIEDYKIREGIHE